MFDERRHQHSGLERTVDTTVRALLIAALLAVVSLAVYFSNYAYPKADDHERMVYLMDLGFVGANVREYREWYGRWLATSISYAVIAGFDLTRSYPVWLGVIGSTFAAALWALLAACFRPEVRQPWIALATLLLLVLHWDGVPSPGETFYWFSGALEYQGSLTLALLALAAVIGASRRAAGSSATAYLVAAVPAAFGVAGLHELVGALLAASLAVGTCVTWRRRPRARHVWGIALAASLAGTLVSVLAPGNAVRSTLYLGHGQLDVAVPLTLRMCREYLGPWLLDVRLLSATVWIVMGTPLVDARPDWARAVRGRWLLIVPAAVLSCLVGGFFATSWGLALPTPPRTAGAFHLLFLLGWFATAICSAGALDRSLRGPAGRWTGRAAAMLLAVSVLVTGNARRATRDLGDRAPRYQRAMEIRYQQIRHAQAGGPRHLVVPRTGRAPRSVFAYDITTDAGHVRNRTVARAYGLESIAIERRETRGDR